MMYLQFLEILENHAEEKFAAFQRKLIPTTQRILGVRTPVMRTIAKDYISDLQDVFAFPDEVFEVTFIKLTMVSLLPYSKFLSYVEDCVAKMDNWATCDSFKAKCIQKNKQAFLPILEKLFARGTEFYQRYPLTVLLSFYVDEEYLELIESYLQRADTQFYYVYMATAWLTAEVLVKHYDYGLRILQKGVLDTKTHNKAIQKAIESYRLTNGQKEYLRSLKIKNKR